MASETLEGEPSQSYLGDTFRLEYAENRGAFLGLAAAWPAPMRIGLLVVGAGIAMAGLAMACSSSAPVRPT